VALTASPAVEFAVELAGEVVLAEEVPLAAESEGAPGEADAVLPSVELVPISAEERSFLLMAGGNAELVALSVSS